jgi:hypothetical protein
MVVEGATLATFVMGTITMLIIGILLNIVGLGIFCWALFALATHALPFFVGMTGGIYSFQVGASPFDAVVVGFVLVNILRRSRERGHRVLYLTWPDFPSDVLIVRVIVVPGAISAFASPFSEFSPDGARVTISRPVPPVMSTAAE